jgi:hypothetical protein
MMTVLNASTLVRWRMPYTDPEKQRECVERYYQAHRPEILERYRGYQKKRAGTPKEKNRRLGRYGVTLEWFGSIWHEQEGLCGNKACGRPLTDTVHVDHDHRCCDAESRSCGRCVRGLLCVRCNTGLGIEDPTILRGKADYLERFPVAQPWTGSIRKVPK